MPLYDYSAINEKGGAIRGTISASNEVDLETRLKNIGLDVTFYSEARPFNMFFSRKVSLKELILLCVHMEQLEHAGVPILDAISDMRDSTENPALKNLLSDIFESIKGGNLLSQAMGKHPRVFSPMFTGLIEAGEKTGNMAQVFSHLAEHYKWVTDIQRKIKKASYYPIVLLLMMVCVLSIMMLFVIPKLSDFLLQQNIELPFYTRLLIDISQGFQNYWYIILPTPLVVYFGIKGLCSVSEEAAYTLDVFKLKIPVIGKTIQKIELARFCRFFSVTFQSGVGILECLDVAQNVMDNRVIKGDVAVIKKSVSEGSSITNALRLSNQFPQLVVRMFKVGEDSGNLDESLKNINFFYDREVRDSIGSMIAIIQPILTIVMGALMLWISMAVFGPLYGSFGQMQF